MLNIWRIYRVQTPSLLQCCCLNCKRPPLRLSLLWWVEVLEGEVGGGCHWFKTDILWVKTSPGEFSGCLVERNLLEPFRQSTTFRGVTLPRAPVSVTQTRRSSPSQQLQRGQVGSAPRPDSATGAGWEACTELAARTALLAGIARFS